ncbi:hypothetical protein QE152_g33752 [Popillia japonica]|uniref:Uncharacterized protein n=1 Tax=Popillia japonica TaxID=7064 RepID=A0AAW1IV57_POPJA
MMGWKVIRVPLTLCDTPIDNLAGSFAHRLPRLYRRKEKLPLDFTAGNCVSHSIVSLENAELIHVAIEGLLNYQTIGQICDDTQSLGLDKRIGAEFRLFLKQKVQAHKYIAFKDRCVGTC